MINAFRNLVSFSATFPLALALAVVFALPAAGQDRGRRKKGPPKPRIETLETRDGVNLRCFYFPSDKGKKAVTVLLVHDWAGQASPYGKLVVALRDAGCAVLVPDYRGHGGSMEYPGRRGEMKKFNLARMNRRDVENVIKFDLETAKGFLKEENNEGKLNLNALVMIGVREGCVLASAFAARDWRFPSVGKVKQGQDVKALVLISPDKQVKGVPLEPTLTDPNLLRLPMLVVAGMRSTEYSDARRIQKKVESIKKRMNRGSVVGFQLVAPENELSGPALVNESSAVIPAVVEFVSNSVPIDNSDNGWVSRE